MTDKEKIRAEIKRLGSEVDKDYNERDYGVLLTCKKLIKFIDSLPEEPVSEDLEEAAKEYRYHANLNPERYKTFGSNIMNAFIVGANWQKQQMMKDAIEGEITDDVLCKHLCYDTGKFLEAWGKFNIGDKVKLIIIKED